MEQPLFQRPASSCTAAKHPRMKIDLDLCSILSVHALLAGAETLHAWNLRAPCLLFSVMTMGA